MVTCLTYVGAVPHGHARYNLYFTQICSGSDSHLASCDNCGGEGGFYFPEDEQSLEAFDECPACGGSGYVEGEAPSLTLSDLEERAP